MNNKLKPSDKPSNIPENLWDAKMSIEGYWSEDNEVDVVGSLESLIEYLIEKEPRLARVEALPEKWRERIIHDIEYRPSVLANLAYQQCADELEKELK